MRLVKQKQLLPIENLDLVDRENQQSFRHGPLLPNSIRCIICGPSNCGKTNVMLSLIKDGNGLKFTNIYLYSKSLHQSKYLFLREVLKPIRGMGFYTFNDNDNVLDPEEARKDSIIIFDDVACDKQDKIRAYFSMGRHHCVDCFYLSQTYTRIPKHLIRDNANMLIIFKQDDLNLKHLYNDHVNTDVSFDEFKNICAECWKEKYGFLVINKDCVRDGRYRKGFDIYIYP